MKLRKAEPKDAERLDELLTAFRQYAREKDACRMELKVLSQNETALKLYESFGFQETKKYMALDLQEAEK